MGQVAHVKQLPCPQKMDYFAMVLFHINPCKGDISHIYKFKRGSDCWMNTSTFTQESGDNKEIMKNCFQVSNSNMDLFLHFTEEHMTVLNAENGSKLKRVAYMKTIDNSLEQCLTCIEDYSGQGAHFLFSFEIRSDNILKNMCQNTFKIRDGELSGANLNTWLMRVAYDKDNHSLKDLDRTK